MKRNNEKKKKTYAQTHTKKSNQNNLVMMMAIVCGGRILTGRSHVRRDGSAEFGAAATSNTI